MDDAEQGHKPQTQGCHFESGRKVIAVPLHSTFDLLYYTILFDSNKEENHEKL